MTQSRDSSAPLQTGMDRRDFLTGAAALGVAGATVGPLAGPAEAQTPRRGGHLILGLNAGSTSDSLDPARHVASYMSNLGPQFSDALTVVDESAKVKPALAVSWDPKPGAKEWVIKLRRGVTFHNGKEMTAADVVYSINHHRGADSKSVIRSLVAQFTEVKATDKYEVTIALNSGNADLPFVLAEQRMPVAPDASNFTDGMGTGAFILESFEPGVRARVKKNPNDWRSDRGWVDTVESLAIPNATARLAALQSGAVHLIDRIDPKGVAALEANPKLQVFNTTGSAHCCFAMWIDTAPFDNLDLRLALKYAIDRPAILRTVLRGSGKIGNDHPIAGFHPYFASDIPQRGYDPDKAKFHYQKSGHSGPLSLAIADVTFAGAVDMAQLFQATALRAGINIDVNRVPNDGYWSNVWLKRPFVGTYWAGRTTADLLFSAAYASNATWNESHWKRPKFDELLIQARAELDDAKRRRMYQDMQLMLHEEGGSIIPAFYNYIVAGDARLAGYVPNPVLDMAGFRAAEKVWFAS
ncbi:MAG: ABC transporter substrate-binding protein [Alphaproteobacteria bacterium]|nr:ABC transporter substrate-binding protein [Alphaproteobacteria bacterium]